MIFREQYLIIRVYPQAYAIRDLTCMARSKSSHQWLKAHFDDEYVKRAQREGYP